TCHSERRNAMPFLPGTTHHLSFRAEGRDAFSPGNNPPLVIPSEGTRRLFFRPAWRDVAFRSRGIPPPLCVASFPPCHITSHPLCFPLMRAPRKLFSESDLYNAALRALMRRAHSVYEMRQALERRAEDKTLVRRVLDRLKEGGLLDDSRYARQFARYHAETRRQGKFRIARDLRGRGIPDRHIESALEEVFQEKDEGEMVRNRIDRNLKSFRGLHSDQSVDDRRLSSIY